MALILQVRDFSFQLGSAAGKQRSLPTAAIQQSLKNNFPDSGPRASLTPVILRLYLSETDEDNTFESTAM
jgi:hypothetical protein